jgi:hypothetical protein
MADEYPDGKDVDVALALMALGIIDTMEYEAKIDIEEAAAKRRRIFEADSHEDADDELQKMVVDWHQRGIIEVDSKGQASLPFEPNLLKYEDE